MTVHYQNYVIILKSQLRKVGLKKPITVRRSHTGIKGKQYDLVCGQGRIEAFQACGQTEIPAIIINANEEEALIMSLVENLARRQQRPLDLLHGIEVLQQKGYDGQAIAQKTGMTDSYVYAILDLLKRGEERLLVAVETGQIPVTIAVSIVNAPNDEQRALQEAYESNQLRGSKFKAVKKLLEVRKARGKSLSAPNPKSGRRKNAGLTSVQDVLKVYQKEVDRKKLLARKADIVSNRMLFISEALRRLLVEDHFALLLENEGLTTMPKQLAALLEAKK